MEVNHSERLATTVATGKELITLIGQKIIPRGSRHPDDEGFKISTKEQFEIYKKVY
ncbi:MAG: hypothetical protein IAF38_21080, partial [Bacteroidia bacterium]|nr:hypothetical protein [Bacteroidia bacterium]